MRCSCWRSRRSVPAASAAPFPDSTGPCACWRRRRLSPQPDDRARSLIWLAEHHEGPVGALRHAMQTLELSRAAGDRMPEIMSLNDVGYSHALFVHYW
jgi:hypothetical protein